MRFLIHEFATRLGRVLSVVDEQHHLVELSFLTPKCTAEQRYSALSSVLKKHNGELVKDAQANTEVVRQIHAFCAGERKEFDLPLAYIGGTEFQRRVWSLLQTIPFGTTTTYGALAEQLFGSMRACRAVGQAIGKNPHALVVPCHRVIGSSGAITGFAAGIEQKRVILAHEGVAC
jgi:methylated-DNA-[protein]-cysteine S-methyltransferase